MIDSLEMVRPAIEARCHAEKLKLEKRGFGVVTLHRPSNVDEPAKLKQLVDLLAGVQIQVLGVKREGGFEVVGEDCEVVHCRGRHAESPLAAGLRSSFYRRLAGPVLPIGCGRLATRGL
jgi:hypothetical protein